MTYQAVPNGNDCCIAFDMGSKQHLKQGLSNALDEGSGWLQKLRWTWRHSTQKRHTMVYKLDYTTGFLVDVGWETQTSHDDHFPYANHHVWCQIFECVLQDSRTAVTVDCDHYKTPQTTMMIYDPGVWWWLNTYPILSTADEPIFGNDYVQIDQKGSAGYHRGSQCQCRRHESSAIQGKRSVPGRVLGRCTRRLKMGHDGLQRILDVQNTRLHHLNFFASLLLLLLHVSVTRKWGLDEGGGRCVLGGPFFSMAEIG